MEAVGHIWLCNCSILNFLIYEENLIFFLSVCGTVWGDLILRLFIRETFYFSDFYGIFFGCITVSLGARGRRGIKCAGLFYCEYSKLSIIPFPTSTWPEITTCSPQTIYCLSFTRWFKHIHTYPLWSVSYCKSANLYVLLHFYRYKMLQIQCTMGSGSFYSDHKQFIYILYTWTKLYFNSAIKNLPLRNAHYDISKCDLTIFLTVHTDNPLYNQSWHERERTYYNLPFLHPPPPHSLWGGGGVVWTFLSTGDQHYIP